MDREEFLNLLCEEIEKSTESFMYDGTKLWEICRKINEDFVSFFPTETDKTNLRQLFNPEMWHWTENKTFRDAEYYQNEQEQSGSFGLEEKQKVNQYFIDFVKENF